MGVMGWTYDQALETPIPAIKRAIKGRYEFLSEILKAVFGPGEDKPNDPPTPARPLSAKLFDALFPSHSRKK